MRFARLVLLALIPWLSGSPASAQNAGPILDFFAGQIDREIARQQNRQIQKQQQQQHNQNWQIFLAAWNDCFERNDLARCDFALTYPGMGADDHQRLLVKRAEIAAAIQAQEEAVRLEQAERAAQERQRRIDAANEARRQRQEQAAEAARLRQQAFDQQRAQAEQARRERIAEEKRLAGMRALRTALQGCQRFDPAGCDLALASEHTSPDKLDTLREWRAIGVAYASDRPACQAGEIDACDRALASRAVSESDRPQLTEWRTAASPLNRTIAAFSVYSATALATAQAVPGALRDLPLSTQITGGVATVLALALTAVMIRRAPASPVSVMPVQPAPQVPPATAPPRRQRLRRWLRRVYIRMLMMRRWYLTAPAKQPKMVVSASPTGTAAAVTAVQDRPRDTETAVDAMQLVLAYTAEFQGNIGDTLTDPAYAAKVLNTLSLISRQLDIAERADATAILTVENDSDEHVAYTITSLKAGAIYYEAMCRMADNPKHAIRLLEQVLELAPDAAHAHFGIGMLNAEMLNKAAAVAAFEQAVALDPRNMEYRKELLRAQSISGSQVAYDRAARGVRTTVSVARWAWYAFWIITVISVVAAIAKGDFTLVIVLGVLFAAFGMLKQCLVILKNALTGEE